jgi:hypothetical protein
VTMGLATSGLVWLLCFELCASRILALGVGVIVGVSLRNPHLKPPMLNPLSPNLFGVGFVR